ncbi:MAG: YibE/F family protein [Candidatus Shapirobacteria bacterium]|nr:YibE/F family protein [Candidatus Shapirobacteria bacterium]
MFLKKFFCVLILLFFSIGFFNQNIFAQSETGLETSKEESLETIVQNILEEKQIKPDGAQNYQLYQKLELLVTKGSIRGQKIIVENGNLPVINNIRYKEKDKLIVISSQDLDGNNLFYISDYIRRDVLFYLFLIFIVLVAVIAKWRGALSLLGMLISFLVIFYFILPKILSGSDPVLTAILGSLIIIPVSFLLSHGFNKKTIVAIIGTFISLIITGVLAIIFVQASKLTGFSSEEAGFLQSIIPGVINIKGLLLAGIIIGALGVLDDITISQSAIVYQLKEANHELKFTDLYKRAMSVGRDHISSMVNTLILVYTGAALPLLLLFINNPHPFSEVINYEIVAEEIVRTLVGSIGLISAVPITTLIAVLVINNQSK